MRPPKTPSILILDKKTQQTVAETKGIKYLHQRANDESLKSDERRKARRILQRLLEEKPHLKQILKDVINQLAQKKTLVAKEWKPVQLKSKRATLVTEQTVCSECRRKISVAWRYAESNHGIVYICDKCKLAVRERSFGCVGKLKNKQDALDHAVSGGQFESNRRKH